MFNNFNFFDPKRKRSKTPSPDKSSEDLKKVKIAGGEISETELDAEMGSNSQILQEISEVKKLILDSENRTNEKLLEIQDSLDTTLEINGKIAALEQKVNIIWKNAQRKHIIIHGIQEKAKETDQDREKIWTDLMESLQIGNIQFDDIYRLGKPGKPNRPLFVKLLRTWDKKTIMRSRIKLKGTKTFINDDMEKGERETNAILLSKLREVRQTAPNAKGFIRSGILTFKVGDELQKFQLDSEGTVVVATEIMNTSK
jgi:hypothetical protein